MTAALRLYRAPGFGLEVPDGPGMCETCREWPATWGPYCDGLCAAFDAALGALAAAYHDADGDRLAAPVVLARTRLRALAVVFDARRLGVRVTRATLDAWAADVAAGVLLPVGFRAAVRDARRSIG